MMGRSNPEQRIRTELQRRAFISGIEWVAIQLDAAATLASTDHRAEISGHSVIVHTGDAVFATRLRQLASTLRTEAVKQATERYPNWKE